MDDQIKNKIKDYGYMRIIGGKDHNLRKEIKKKGEMIRVLSSWYKKFPKEVR